MDPILSEISLAAERTDNPQKAGTKGSTTPLFHRQKISKNIFISII